MAVSINWETASSFPFHSFSDPIQSNNKEFVVVAAKDPFCSGDGVYSFNVDRNEWVKIMDYDKDSTFYCHAIAFNEKSQSIYTWIGNKASLYSFNLTTKKCQQLTTFMINSCNVYTQMIYIQGDLHLIDHGISRRHFIWNEQRNETQQIHQFENIGYGFKLIHIQSTNKLLLIGGSLSDLIYEFCLKNKKWQKWKTKVPKTLHCFGAVSTRFGTHSIIFGGYSKRDLFAAADIFVFDMSKKCMFKSKVTCPRKGIYRAFVTNDIDRDNLLCFGYIAHCFKEKNMKHIYLSLDIVQLIAKYICFEDVHLIQNGTGQHYKINADDILRFL